MGFGTLALILVQPPPAELQSPGAITRVQCLNVLAVECVQCLKDQHAPNEVLELPLLCSNMSNTASITHSEATNTTGQWGSPRKRTPKVVGSHRKQRDTWIPSSVFSCCRTGIADSESIHKHDFEILLVGKLRHDAVSATRVGSFHVRSAVSVKLGIRHPNFAVITLQQLTIGMNL